MAALLYFYSIHTNSTNIALLALAIIFLAFMPMSYLRRPFWESDEIQSCNKNLTDNMKEFLIEKACFSKSQLEILIKQYNLDYSNESKASLMSTEKFPPIFTLLITPFTICVTTFLAAAERLCSVCIFIWRYLLRCSLHYIYDFSMY